MEGRIGSAEMEGDIPQSAHDGQGRRVRSRVDGRHKAKFAAAECLQRGDHTKCILVAMVAYSRTDVANLQLIGSEPRDRLSTQEAALLQHCRTHPILDIVTGVDCIVPNIDNHDTTTMQLAAQGQVPTCVYKWWMITM